MSKQLQWFIIFAVLLAGFMSMTSLGYAAPATQNDPAAQCNSGSLLLLTGQMAKAWPLLEEGFAGLQQSPTADQTALGLCGVYLGMLQMNIRDLSGALETYTAALKAFETTGDQQMQWTMLYGLGSIYMAQGRPDLARVHLEQALTLSQTPGNWAPAKMQQLAQASTLNNLGLITVLEPEIESFQDPIQIDETDNAQNLLSAGQPTEQDHYETARGYFNAALDILRQLKEPQSTSPGDAIKPGNSNDLSQLFQLLDQMTSSQTQSEDKQSDEAALLLALLASMNDDADSEQNPFESLLNGLAGGNNQSPFGGIGNLLSMGLLEDIISATAEGIEGIVLYNIGETYRLQEQYQQATDYFYQSQAVAAQSQQQSGVAGPSIQLVGLRNEALIQNGLALIDYAQGKPDFALVKWENALEIMRRLHIREGIASTLSNIGYAKLEQGQTEEALLHYTEAIALYETLRGVSDPNLSNIVSEGGMTGGGNTFALSGSLIPFASDFEVTAYLYHQQGQNEDAFYAAERGRSRLFLELLTSSKLTLTDSEAADLLKRERQAYALRQAAEDALRADSLTSFQGMLGPNLQTQLAEAEAAYQQAVADLRAKDERLTTLVSGQGGVLTVSEVQHLLDEETTLISYYFVGDTPPLAFILTQKEFVTVELPEANLEDIHDNLVALHRWGNTETSPKTLEDLYAVLIAPLRKHLKTDTVGIIPHKVLHYVPFAALNDGETYFGERYNLFTLPSASSLALLPANNSGQPTNVPSNVLVFGNPETDNRLPPLAYASTEAQSIARLFDVPAYIGPSATENLFWAEAGQAQIIHLAAHGVYSETSPLDSALYLASDGQYDGQLQVREVYNLGLTHNDLIVLSACETNVGELSSGDELVGLTRAFFFAGSPSVVTSLWQVEDKATADFMAAFYRHWQSGAGKAEALRLTQTELRQNGYDKKPYYWAAFVLNGRPD